MNHNHTPTLIQSPPHMHTHMHICVYIQEGYLPLHNASAEGYDGIVEMLLQAGATVDLQTKVEDCDLTLFICHVLCSLYTTTQYSKHTCPAHSQWLMQFSTIVDTVKCSYQNNNIYYQIKTYIIQRDFPHADEHHLLPC